MMTFKQLRQITDVHEEAKFSIRLFELTTCDDGTQDIQCIDFLKAIPLSISKRDCNTPLPEYNINLEDYLENDFCDDLDRYDDYIVLHLHCDRFGNRIVIINPNAVELYKQFNDDNDEYWENNRLK